ncbi:MAG: hypothetical protein M3354_10310 [Chloroflexota bacterium]|nr:hypothetical protein [Chloroflexota bacterium]
MIVDTFEDSCLRVSVQVDDVWHHIVPALSRPGVACRQELVAMVPIGECHRWDENPVFVSASSEHRDLVPVSPSAPT